MSLYHRGFSLVEVLIVTVLIAGLMVLSLPMLSVANAEARSVACKQNLVEIGEAVTGYIAEHDRLPSITPAPPQDQGLSLPEFLDSRLDAPHALLCPSDETQRSQTLGTSYAWATAHNGVKLADLAKAVDQPLVFDREIFHAGTEMAVNELVLQRNKAGGFALTVIGSPDQPREYLARPDTDSDANDSPGEESDADAIDESDRSGPSA